MARFGCPRAPWGRVPPAPRSSANCRETSEGIALAHDRADQPTMLTAEGGNLADACRARGLAFAALRMFQRAADLPFTSLMRANGMVLAQIHRTHGVQGGIARDRHRRGTPSAPRTGAHGRALRYPQPRHRREGLSLSILPAPRWHRRWHRGARPRAVDVMLGCWSAGGELRVEGGDHPVKSAGLAEQRGYVEQQSFWSTIPSQRTSPSVSLRKPRLAAVNVRRGWRTA